MPGIGFWSGSELGVYESYGASQGKRRAWTGRRKVNENMESRAPAELPPSPKCLAALSQNPQNGEPPSRGESPTKTSQSQNRSLSSSFGRESFLPKTFKHQAASSPAQQAIR